MAPTSLKRKMRKTRRSLNEMRNRIIVTKSSNINFRNIKQNAISKCSNSSGNRFILPNKMVRSETVTRSILHDSKQIDKSIINSRYCSKNTADCNNTDTDSNMSKSDDLFSPLRDFSLENEESKVQNDKTISGSLSLEEEFSENIYDIFLSVITQHILETAPDLVHTDIIDKKQQSVENIFSEIEMLSPSNLSITMNTKVTNTFAENCTATDSSPSDNQINFKQFTHDHLQVAYSGNISSSAESMPSVSIYVSPMFKFQNVYDSPEYSYYPHRLNY